MWGERRNCRVARRSGHTRSIRGRWIVLSGAVLIAALLIVMFSLRGARIANLREGIATMDARLATAMLDREDLERRLARQNDLDAIETAARELFGWVLPGEIKIVFIEPSEGAE